MNLEQLIAELAKQDKAAVADALHKGAPSIWQEVFNKGHATATAASAEKLRTAETALATAQTELTTAKQQLTEAEKGKPDVEKIRADYQTEIGNLTQKHADEKKRLQGELERERKSTVLEKLRTELSKRLDPEYADVKATQAEPRIRITATGHEIMQEGKEIPYAPASGQTAVGLLADEIIKAAPAKFQLAKTDAGGGTRSDAGTGGGTTTLSQVRAKAEAERRVAADRANQKSGAERLGMRAPL